MKAEEFVNNIRKRGTKNGLIFTIGAPLSDDSIAKSEKRLNVSIPDQVKYFYKACNGLLVEDPALEIKRLEQLAIDKNGMMVFSIFNKEHTLCFDTQSINSASQWEILNYQTGFEVTKTMASFWSNKVFAWLDKQRTIWKKEIY